MKNPFTNQENKEEAAPAYQPLPKSEEATPEDVLISQVNAYRRKVRLLTFMLIFAVIAGFVGFHFFAKVKKELLVEVIYIREQPIQVIIVKEQPIIVVAQIEHRARSGLVAAPAPNSHVPQTIERSAHLAGIAYSPEKDLTNWSCPLCVVNNGTRMVKFIEDKPSDTYVYIAKDDSKKQLIVSFRGSKTIRNWADDAKMIQKKIDWLPELKEVKVHTGFLNNFNKVKDQIMKTILEQIKENPGYSILVTGHSSGGAMATLQAFYFLWDKTLASTKIDVVTFGAPRVGNAKFAQAFETLTRVRNSDSYRVVNNADPIPHIFPRSMGYSHGAREIWIKHREHAAFMCGVEDDQCSNSLSIREYSPKDHVIPVKAGPHCGQ